MLCRNAEPGDTVASPEQHNHRFPIFSDKDFGYEDAPPIDHSNSDPDQATLNDSERRNMLELLGAWYGISGLICLGTSGAISH